MSAPQVSRLTVYGADWCPDVRRSRALLDDRGVAYDYIDIEQSPQAEGDVRALQGGERRIPTIVWPDGSHLIEPSDETLAARLESS